MQRRRAECIDPGHGDDRNPRVGIGQDRLCLGCGGNVVWRRRHRTIQIKTSDEIALMRQAGLVVAHTLRILRNSVRPGVTTAELDQIAEDTIRQEGAVPSFLGYQGFPATICTSINDQIVHGIPSKTRRLRRGDIISIDCGAVLDGWHSDAAITVPVGQIPPEIHELLDTCEDALWAGINAAQPGARIGDIGSAVQSSVDSSPRQYAIIRQYGGHGIGTELHQEPHVPNQGRPGRGLRLTSGLVLAIEPMIATGTSETRQLADGWTVVTADHSLSAHSEHTVAITDDGPLVLTAEDDGAERLGQSANNSDMASEQ